MSSAQDAIRVDVKRHLVFNLSRIQPAFHLRVAQRLGAVLAVDLVRFFFPSHFYFLIKHLPSADELMKSGV